MINKINIKLILLVVITIGTLGCSKKKKGFTHRAYQNTVSHYNGYFNAREIYKVNKARISNEHKDDFSEIIPLFIYPDETQAKAMYPDMDKIVEKTSTVIDRHSIYIKKYEYNRWIDDSYMLMGKARFYKQEYFIGEEIFEYIAKAFRNQDAKYDALIWLARTQMELNAMNKAESYLTLIEEQGVPNQYSSDFNAVYADFYLRKNNYDDAIKKLEKALETTKGRQNKRRFNYVLAQLWLKKKEYGKASELFSAVINLKPKYDMMFNAKISRALSFDPKSRETKDIKKMLSRMVKDGKNAEFLDQIHYALADIAFKEKNEPLGIDHLQKSAALSVSNNKQKALSYLRLGELFYEKPLYVESQAYYDSCLTILPKDYKRYESIYNRTKALSKLVKNIIIVQEEDSLQTLANDETYRDKVIKKLVEEAIEEEERKEEEEEEEDFSSFNNNSSAPSSLPNSGKWYFYNTTTLAFGFTDFKKNWADRKLADDWRRSNKETVASFEEDLEENSDTNSSDNTKIKIDEKTTPEYYLQFIPLTEKDMNISHNKIIEALYALGNIYREDFKDFKNSIKSFENLITRYDTCIYKLPSWYNLYRISILIEDDPMKQKYKELILNYYPESEYARIIQDPSYNKVTRENRKRVDNYYNRVYNLYSDRAYSKVLIRCKKAKSIFADNHLQDHFDFLAAMSIGHTNIIDSFKIALNNVIISHPESEVSVEANRILELIKKGIKLESDAPEANTIDYNHIFDADFNFVVIVPGEDKKTNKYKVDISNFNSKYYTNKLFNVSNIMLDPINQILIVKSFKGSDAAIDYFKSFKLNQDNLKDLNLKEYKYFLISRNNFALFYKNKDIKGYIKFFKENFNIEL